MDRQKAAIIHAELAKTLKAFAEQHGLTVSPFNMQFSEDGIKAGIAFGDKSAIGDMNLEYVRNLQKFGFMYNLTKEDLNTTMKVNGQDVTFTGLRNKTKAAFTKADGSKMMIDAREFAKQNGRIKAI